MIDEIDYIHCKLKAPFNAIVAGPSGCGKTTWVRSLIEHHNSVTTIATDGQLKVVWCYGQYQNGYKNIIPNSNVSYREGLISEDELISLKPQLLVIDDLQSELCSSREMADLFMKKSHHLNISVILILQNIFAQGSQMRNISLNAHYQCAFKNNRDSEQLLRFGRQACPRQLPFFNDMLKDIFSTKFGYLFCDFHPTTPEQIKFRTEILPKSIPLPTPVIYIPK